MKTRVTWEKKKKTMVQDVFPSDGCIFSRQEGYCEVSQLWLYFMDDFIMGLSVTSFFSIFWIPFLWSKWDHFVISKTKTCLCWSEFAWNKIFLWCFFFLLGGGLSLNEMRILRSLLVVLFSNISLNIAWCFFQIGIEKKKYQEKSSFQSEIEFSHLWKVDIKSLIMKICTKSRFYEKLFQSRFF